MRQQPQAQTLATHSLTHPLAYFTVAARGRVGVDARGMTAGAGVIYALGRDFSKLDAALLELAERGSVSDAVSNQLYNHPLQQHR